MSYIFLIHVLIRSILAVLVGVLIGSERGRHGRAAGMRTHILVCLGAALTAMTSVYLSESTGYSGDLTRISAQVISGIGFLGAGMIILKNNSKITGLTTAAGVWATSIIGIALGYGFYVGALLCALLVFTAISVFSKFERRRKNTENIYVEIDNMYDTNRIMGEIECMISSEITQSVLPPKSNAQGHLGINIVMEEDSEFDILRLKEITGVVFVEGE